MFLDNFSTFAADYARTRRTQKIAAHVFKFTRSENHRKAPTISFIYASLVDASAELYETAVLRLGVETVTLLITIFESHLVKSRHTSVFDVAYRIGMQKGMRNWCDMPIELMHIESVQPQTLRLPIPSYFVQHEFKFCKPILLYQTTLF